ncbi:conserved protein of unknown function [Rhodovastum atsumiense]|uniref:Uncharacterized protein n=1 Tax=Rhodovastum atsumiense TaxID=504468 RepID=A0A5M6IVV0_9PROT|nr:hypothetical protein [Rhodovastum atsumiense]KAA5612450.1 hypothetical protein F1189_09750 [Rhodovastum atsumiense]CAH2600358.1 conserved protein of unknown function [Rhodovastum atsumiense]
MPLDIPFTIGPFRVEPDGRLAPSTPEHFPSFHVRWRGHRLQARLAAHDAAGGTLALQTVIGRIPSTGRAEAPGTAQREAAFTALQALRTVLPQEWRLALLPDHRVAVNARATITLPTSAEALITGITLFLLQMAPYLELADASLPFEPAGTAGAEAPGIGPE